MGFSVLNVARLDYDFTGFPQDGAADPSLRCTGKAFIPEPSKALVEAFWQNTSLEAFMKAAGDDGSDSEAVEAHIYESVSAVCSGKPSVDELRQLPPRIFRLFVDYLRENLAPKA